MSKDVYALARQVLDRYRAYEVHIECVTCGSMETMLPNSEGLPNQWRSVLEIPEHQNNYLACSDICEVRWRMEEPLGPWEWSDLADE